MEGDESIVVGKIFDGEDDLFEAFKKFNTVNLTELGIETHSKREITFPCKRGGCEC